MQQNEIKARTSLRNRGESLSGGKNCKEGEDVLEHVSYWVCIMIVIRLATSDCTRETSKSKAKRSR